MAYIGLGSNVGERAETLARALAMLDQTPGVRVLRRSSLIETDPVGPPQDRYLNGAAALETELAPSALLARLHDIEAALGRDRRRELRWGPRTCDLDILLMDDLVIDEAAVTIPHPRMHERLFVLRPLAEIAPEATHPLLGETVRRMLERREAER